MKKLDIVSPKLAEISRYFAVPIQKEKIDFKEDGRLVRLISLEWRGTLTLFARTYKTNGNFISPQYDDEDFESLNTSVVSLENPELNDELRRFIEGIYTKLKRKGYRHIKDNGSAIPSWAD